MRPRILAIVCTLAALGAAPAHAAPIVPGCADPAHAGGEWRSYGHDLANTRNQPDEHSINASTVRNVAKAWVFDTNAIPGGGGTFSNTPVVADGCLFLASSTGVVYAVNPDSGVLVWKSVKLPGSGCGSLCGNVITGSPSVENGLVYVAVAKQYKGPPIGDDPNGPAVYALNEQTGVVEWITPVMDPTKATDKNLNSVVAGPVVSDGVIFQGIMSGESQPAGSNKPRGGYAIIDALTGTRIFQGWTIPDSEYSAGYLGASVWCTAAVDAANGYAYACGGNPASGQLESRHSNALLKIDIDQTRATFGDIVGTFKGNADNYYPQLYQQPVCRQFDDQLAVVWSQACVQQDLDFGSSPNLITIDVGGTPTTLVGDLQKSGIYYAAYADDMGFAWSSIVGTPGFPLNSTNPATADGSVFVAGGTPYNMWSLTANDGGYEWVSPITPVPIQYQSVSTANGVVYTLTALGDLVAFDAATGVPMLRRPLILDTLDPTKDPTTQGRPNDLSSQGVAIARNTIYAASGPFVVAYR
jgi:polyvinyl alcohol dehydrogenase (cytochrome)